MMSFKDRTFCVSENCQCGRKLTPELRKEAQDWWNEIWAGKKKPHEEPPIAFSYFCGEP